MQKVLYKHVPTITVQHVHIQHTSMWLHKYGTCHQLLSEYSQYAIELLVESVLLYRAGVWGCGGQLGPVEKYGCGQLEFLGEWGGSIHQSPYN